MTFVPLWLFSFAYWKAASIVFASTYKDGIEVPFLPLEMPEIKIGEKPEALAWELGSVKLNN